MEERKRILDSFDVGVSFLGMDIFIIDHLRSLVKDTDTEKETALYYVDYALKWTNYLGQFPRTTLKNISKIVSANTVYEYFMVTGSGKRKATRKEIEQGASGLQADIRIRYEKYDKILNMLAWIVTGYTGHYNKAGFFIEYGDGAIQSDVIVMLKNAASVVKELVNDGSVVGVLSELKKCSKSDLSTYPTYAEDEVEEKLDIKVVMELVYKRAKSTKALKGSDVRLVDICKRYTSSKRKQNFNISPLQAAKIRKLYARILEEQHRGNESGAGEKLKEVHTLLLRAADLGHLESNDFALKILKTIGSLGYKSCTDKQWEIIQERLNKLRYDGTEVKKEVEQESIDIRSAYDLLE